MKDFIAVQKQEALSDIKPKEEILPQVYFFMKDKHTSLCDKQKIQENIKNMNPVEMTLLKDLTTTELKAFFTGNYKIQQDILNQHNFSQHSWKETMKALVSFTSSISPEKQIRINNRNIVNNILTRRLERVNLLKHNGLKI